MLLTMELMLTDRDGSVADNPNKSNKTGNFTPDHETARAISAGRSRDIIWKRPPYVQTKPLTTLEKAIYPNWKEDNRLLLTFRDKVRYR